MTIGSIALALVFVALNAFFVAAEFGLVAARRSRIDQLAGQGVRRAAVAQSAMRELNVMLSACQLGITFASLGLGWIGEPAFADLLGTVFEPLPAPLDVIASQGVAVVIAFALITFLHVVLGELVPKNLAIAVPEGVALWLGGPIRAFSVVFRPVIWLFNEGANVVVRLLGVQPQSELRESPTVEELALILDESRRRGVIDTGHGEILSRAVEFSDLRVSDALVPRSDVQALATDATIRDVLDATRRTGYSRFPVHDADPEEYLGVVHVVDMLRATRANELVHVGDAMREPLLVPEALPLSRLLDEMKKRHTHLVVVLDEFGSTLGIVTLHDVVVEFVGDVADEHQVPPSIERLDGGYRVPGEMHRGELVRGTGIPLPDGDYDTVAGFREQIHKEGRDAMHAAYVAAPRVMGAAVVAAAAVAVLVFAGVFPSWPGASTGHRTETLSRTRPALCSGFRGCLSRTNRQLGVVPAAWFRHPG